MTAEDRYRAELDGFLQCFGGNVRYLRIAKGLSQEKLALVTRLHRTEIGRLELGEVDPRLSTLSILADGLEATLDEFHKDLWVPTLRKPAPRARPLAETNKPRRAGSSLYIDPETG